MRVSEDSVNTVDGLECLNFSYRDIKLLLDCASVC